MLVGDDPASQVYVANKRKQTEEVGIRSIHHGLGGATPQEELLELVGELNADDEVDGILVQLPLPEQIDQDAVIAAIDPAKDVDGLTPASAGLLAQGRPGLVPCTPRGRDRADRHAGRRARGRRGGDRRPLDPRRAAAGGLLLGERDRHRLPLADPRPRRGLPRADVLVAAVGSPRLITAEMVKPGATVIDVGINRTDDGLVGDVDFDAVSEVAGAITPVPGGVGPMTIAMLLANTLHAAARSVRTSAAIRCAATTHSIYRERVRWTQTGLARGS